MVGGRVGRGRIWLAMDGAHSFQWRTDQRVSTGPCRISIDHPTYGLTELAAYATRTDGHGVLMSPELGTGTSLTSVIAHWLNLPAVYPTEALSTGSAIWGGRWRCRAAGLIITFDQRPDLAQREQEVSGGRDLMITHFSELRRANGGPFPARRATEALFCCQLAISFAFGRWIPPALPVGFNTTGQRVWESWADWRCDPTTAHIKWLDTHRSEDLRAVVTAFLRHWRRRSTRDVVWHLAHHCISANQPDMPLEARIMLTGSAFEYLSWVNYVLTGKRSRSAHKKLPAADLLRELLRDASIPESLPSQFAALRRIQKNHSTDGPESLFWMRNRLVHPKDRGEPYRINEALLQAWQLSMHYLDLLLLRQIGYSGHYLPRLVVGGWAHDSTPVPWATPSTST